jgi:hypothetical protein
MLPNKEVGYRRGIRCECECKCRDKVKEVVELMYAAEKRCDQQRKRREERVGG